MIRVFGIPFSKELRQKFNAAMLEREKTKPESSHIRRALNEHDNYLEVVANRSSGLVGCYSIFIAILTFLAEGMSAGFLKTALTASAVILACSVLMLLPCLWIYWQREPNIYRKADDEFESTMRLLYRRSTLFNGSLVLSVIAIVGSALSFGIDVAIQRGWFCL